MTRPAAVPTQSVAAPPTTEAAHIRKAGPWQAPDGLRQIPIWPHGAPDMARTPQPGENLEIAPNPEAGPGGTATAIYDVSAPTMTVFPPQGRNTGAAMVVFPGGGFQILAIDLEGTDICHWLTAKGITCILSKYRVPGSNHYWNAACKCHLTPRVLTSLQDAQRTIRLVRAGAGALHVDPHKIGVIGFSAGGYLVAQTSNILAPAYRPVDAADRISSRPDFAIALYPGHLCRDGKLFAGIHVTKQAPPTFLLQAWDDPVDPVCNSTLYARALDEAGVPSEVHLFAKGGHAFALRRTPHAVAIWPSLVEKWLADAGLL
ncbi:MAG: Xylanase [Sphingomonas bacterium]|uniref:alpha/beta hydrolase n=1 Tax=Sphingomonas bacterium TaxID=1895847 RepID=UPI00262D0CE5|nr:alpha/beta hydrolase [Sphingomonas bacterium]MDB5708645.1 Xylanase [Sphingomonas bacterium]